MRRLSEHILNSNDKSEHITNLDNVVRIIITWSGILLLNLKTLAALKIKAAASDGRVKWSAVRRLFSFAVVQQIVVFLITEHQITQNRFEFAFFNVISIIQIYFSVAVPSAFQTVFFRKFVHFIKRSRLVIIWADM